MDEELKKSILKTGTSIIGIVCKDGVVMAADRQVTGGNIVLQKNFRKVIKISDYLAMSFTGGVSDAQMLVKIAAAELRLKALRSKQQPSVKESANLISMISYRNIRQFSTIINIVGSLITGRNEDGSFELFTIEPAGGISRVEDYDANFGSGMPFMLGILERGYKKDMKINEGVQLAIECLKASTERDVGSGFGIDVFTITKDGIKQAVSEEIRHVLKTK